MKAAVRTGSIVLAFLLAVVVGPLEGTRPAEAERIVVANEHASTVQLFDLKTGNVLKDLPTLKRPHEMVLDSKRGVAYISIAYKDGPFSNYERPGNEIQAIGLETMAIVDTIDITPHWAPHGLALDGDHQILYASCESNGGELIAIDLRAKKIALSVRLGVPHPHSVTVVPSLKKAYTANKDAGHISVVDLTNKTVTQIPAPSGTEGIISDGKYVFAGTQTRSELLVVDPKNNEIVKEGSPGSFSQHPGALPRRKEVLHHLLEPSARQDDMGGRFPTATRCSDSNAWTEAQGRALSFEPEHRARRKDGSCGHDGRWGSRGRGPFETENRSDH